MGRKPNSGVKSATDPHREGFTDIRANLLHGSRDWKMKRLRELIGDIRELIDREADALFAENTHVLEGTPQELLDRQLKKHRELPDNLLSAPTARTERTDDDKRYNHLIHEAASLWRDLSAQFEQAVLDGNADWLERQAKAIRSGDKRSDTEIARDQFEAAVARILEMAFWGPRAEQRKRDDVRRELSVSDTARQSKPNKRKDVTQAQKQRTLAKRIQDEKLRSRKNPGIGDATLEPAGKRAGVTARQVLDRLNVETVTRPCNIKGKDGALLNSKRTYVVVEGCRFESKRRACDAITRTAELYGWDLPV